MTTVLHEVPGVVTTRPPARRRVRRFLPFAAAVAGLALLLGWSTYGQHPALATGGYGAYLDARPLDDGLGTSRYVLPIGDGARVVLTSVRNDGRFPMTVLGVDETRSLPWVRATFRAADPTPQEIGFSSSGAAQDAVRDASVVLDPGETAEVLVTFDALPTRVPAEGGMTKVVDLPLVVRHLGLESTRRVPVMHDPLVLVGPAEWARLEREGHLTPAG